MEVYFMLLHCKDVLVFFDNEVGMNCPKWPRLPSVHSIPPIACKFPERQMIVKAREKGVLKEKKHWDAP